MKWCELAGELGVAGLEAKIRHYKQNGGDLRMREQLYGEGSLCPNMVMGVGILVESLPISVWSLGNILTVRDKNHMVGIVSVKGWVLEWGRGVESVFGRWCFSFFLEMFLDCLNWHLASNKILMLKITMRMKGGSL